MLTTGEQESVETRRKLISWEDIKLGGCVVPPGDKFPLDINLSGITLSQKQQAVRR